jgi:glycosyltransferase involved in cell wall biosynthesis
VSSPITISVSAIAKNEASHLPLFLAAVTPWADEVVILDTGSTDAGEAIALAALGGNVRWVKSALFNAATPPGEFRFNLARNEALAHCTRDWIVALDPDFTIPPDFGAKVRGIIAGLTQPMALEIYLEGDGLRYAQCRVWPRGLAVYDLQHSAHEYVVTTLPVRQCSDLTVGHTGRPGAGTRQALAILEADYGRGLRSARLLYNLARARYDNRQWPAAAATYREFLTMVQPGDWMHYYGQLQLARTLFNVDLGEAWREALTALRLDSLRAEAYCLLGDIAHQSLNMKTQARYWWKLALTLPVPPGSRYHEATCYGDYPRRQLKRLNGA